MGLLVGPEASGDAAPCSFRLPPAATALPEANVLHSLLCTLR